MGVVYKLKPEIKEFILEKKKENPLLGCRHLSKLVEERFQIRLSKSSVNSILKVAGLSQPVGRPRKKKKQEDSLTIQPITKPLLTQLPLSSEERAKKEEPEIIPSASSKEEPVLKAPIAPSGRLLEEAKQEESLITSLSKEVNKSSSEQPLLSQSDTSHGSPLEGVKEVYSFQPIELPLERACTGAILLKVADALIGGSYHMSNLIKQYLKEEELLPKLESLIYHPLFESPHKEEKDLTLLWNLVGKGFSSESLLSYLNELKSVEIIPLEFLKIISQDLQEVHCLKIKYLDGTEVYLDAQMYTLWSVPHIPFDFSNTLYKVKDYLNRWYQKNEPLILFTAPGYDLPTKEFFEFILSLDPKEKKEITSLSLWDNHLEEIETIRLTLQKQRFLVFALWPWQFGQYRKVNIKGEFEIGHFENIKKDFYLAEVEVELSQPNVNKKIKLRGAVIRNKPEDRNRLFILTNLPPEKANSHELSKLYLNHWPNLEESFQDFSRKIELFTYTPSARRFFFADNLNLKPESPPEIKAILHYYLKALDFYVMWHFLPFGYEDQHFSTINERFYSLKAKLKEEKDCIQVAFQPPLDYPYLEDLIYACRRVNEREVFSPEGKRFWLSIP